MAVRKSPASSAPAAPPAHGKKRKRLAKAFTRPLDKERKKQAEAVVRERFSLLPGEYEQLLAIKDQLAEQGAKAGKSDLVRAGLLLLAEHSPEEILLLLARLPARP